MVALVLMCLAFERSRAVSGESRANLTFIPRFVVCMRDLYAHALCVPVAIWGRPIAAHELCAFFSGGIRSELR